MRSGIDFFAQNNHFLSTALLSSFGSNKQKCNNSTNDNIL